MRYGLFLLVLLVAATAPAYANEAVGPCPEGFDPDLPVWILDEPPSSDKGSASDTEIFVNRMFLYQPDVLRKLLRLPSEYECYGLMVSLKDEREIRTLKYYQTPAGRAIFLLNEKGEWLRGDRITVRGRITRTYGSDITFTLWRNGGREFVVGRTVLLKRGLPREFYLEQ